MRQLEQIRGRRRFLAGGIAAAAGALAVTAVPLEVAARGSGRHPHDRWLDRLTGEERQLFDATEPQDGRMLSLMLHVLETHRTDYGAPEGSVSAVGTFYGGILFYGLNDTMWQRYRLGEFLQTTDPVTGQPATRNPWRVDPWIRGKPVPRASIEALQTRGAVFLLCHQALVSRAARVAERVGAGAEEVLQDMAANVLPGVVVVPSVIVATQRAQRSGVAYYRV